MHHTQRRRLAPAALAVAIALVASLFSASVASAAGPYDDKVVISQGHVDVFYTTIVDGQALLQVADDTQPGGYVLRPADDVVFHVRPSVDGRTANAFLAEIPGFTNVGDTIYALPQNNVSGRIFPGFGYGIPSAPTTASITYELLDVDGPGNFATWAATGDDSPLVYLNSTLPGSSFTSMANHEHKAWGFTELGAYELTVQVSVLLPGESEPLVSAPTTYTFHVGEELPGDGTDPGGPPADIELTISGAAHHYHAGGVATLTANQDPATDEDHYHWFTRAAGETEWSVVPDALGATYGFIVRTADDGSEVMVRLYDHDHAQIAESDPVTISVDDHGNSPVEGPVITTTLEADAGSLVISVDEGHHDVQLTNLELNAAADRYVATGEVTGIRVSDTRGDDPGWTASGRVRSFTTVDGDVLHGNNLGWAPKVLESSDGQSVSPGAAVDPLLSGGTGVGAWRPLASSEAGSGRGTAVLGADLQLEAPVTLAPGTYQGLLILTVI
ncbi:MAG: choice-of-anchor M domain-containing protein [Acidimicrobiales bacterium]